MATEQAEDVSMSRIRAWMEQQGITLQELGVRMGFGESQARQAAYQFLKGKDPRISSLRRFARAAGIPVEELIAEPMRKKM